VDSRLIFTASCLDYLFDAVQGAELESDHQSKNEILLTLTPYYMFEKFQSSVWICFDFHHVHVDLYVTDMLR